MARGFVRTRFEVKLLVLYILAQLSQPVDLATLTELVLCDEGVDYFLFSDVLDDLTRTGHAQQQNGLISITAKGRANGSICESELAYSVRLLCNKNVAEVNARLRQERMVRAKVVQQSGSESYVVQMALSDDTETVMTLEMLAPDQAQAEQLRANFLKHADQVYNAVLASLLSESEERPT
jgi:hypothetical protein